MSTVFEEAVDHLGDGMKDILTRLTLLIQVGCVNPSIIISSLSSCQRLKEVVAELLYPVVEGPNMVKDLAGMGPNFERVIVCPTAGNGYKCVWAVEFTPGWTLYEGVDYRGDTTYIIERV